jgi:hypothetical protein
MEQLDLKIKKLANWPVILYQKIPMKSSTAVSKRIKRNNTILDKESVDIALN